MLQIVLEDTLSFISKAVSNDWLILMKRLALICKSLPIHLLVITKNSSNKAGKQIDGPHFVAAGEMRNQ